MKALSIRAPWWWYILHYGKDIENRDWRYPSKFRGRFVIHASKWWNPSEVLTAHWEAQYMLRGIRNLQLPRLDELRSLGGHLVGSAEIVDCVTESDSRWFTGPLGLVLRNPQVIERPMLCKGALGLFEIPSTIRL